MEKFDRKKNSYYHGIFIPGFADVSPVLSILSHGIFCKYDLEKMGLPTGLDIGQTNGKYYICVSSNKDHFSRPFDVGFILNEKLKVVKTNTPPDIGKLFRQTSLPIRSGGYESEYQVYRRIKKEDIEAIQIRLESLLKKPVYVEMSKIEYLDLILESMNSIYNKIEKDNITIPVINASDDMIIERKTFEELIKNQKSQLDSEIKR